MRLFAQKTATIGKLRRLRRLGSVVRQIDIEGGRYVRLTPEFGKWRVTDDRGRISLACENWKQAVRIAWEQVRLIDCDLI